MKKLLPYLLIIAAFFAGLFSAPDRSKELEKKFEQEREVILEAIGQKDRQIIEMAAESREIRERMVQDSLRFAGALEANKRAYTALKKRYNEINLNRADAAQLDSILSRLYPD
jgi:gas vesicle protein